MHCQKLGRVVGGHLARSASKAKASWPTFIHHTTGTTASKSLSATTGHMPALSSMLSRFPTTKIGARTFATQVEDTKDSNKNDVEKDLQQKEMELKTAEIIRAIKADLLEADIKGNNDGRIDSEELRMVLKKYPEIFSDKDVVDIGDLFYQGKAGGSVSHEKFMEAIASAVGKGDVDEMGGDHRKMSGASHPLGLGKCGTEYMYGKVRGVYSPEELDVKLTHVEPKTTSDKVAKFAVGVVRVCFDIVSLWKFGEITKAKVLRRVIFLETVAGIPGFVAALNRHFKSLRTFTRDGGMLNMFLDEANNERMHLLSFVRMRDPGYGMRIVVMASQAVVGAGFLVLYAIAPHFCHRFVGYVEEEACHTYTTIIAEIEKAPEPNELSEWRTALAPKIARGYWHLGAEGTVLDMMYAIRADEAEHRDVNHVVSGLEDGQANPLYNPEAEFDKVLKKYVANMLERGKD